MVCVLDSEAYCIVRDKSTITEGGSSQGPYSVNVQGSTTVRQFVRQVANHFSYSPHSIELVLTLPTGQNIVLKESSDETLLSCGIRTGDCRNSFVIQSIDIRESRFKERNAPEEELKLGASASPTTTGEYSSYHIPPPPSTQSSQEYPPYTAGLIKQDTGYVGLVNQAMTCYLNSLLQALYMTPEFRNALYNWQYHTESNDNHSKCIPYQLQRLFLNLQTSRKTAVETTELTKSFGWDSSEAWQQHDIQELCRVMFDALEQVFKGTKQADLIDRLYQGKMLDYVKCLECSKEKSREDTFLDIPLPVRPFGSTVAYSSIEEALQAFVQPETLEGANQYFCESCAKKCDAHKGLKFIKFPYLLTLHLKRFDFDYNTMHRIKLNDKVVFPEQLDLNSFIEQEDGGTVMEKEEGSEGIPDELTMSKCDDSSTTDSGSALDDEGCPASTTTDLPPTQDLNQDDDEGIDVSGGNGSNHNENEKNRFHGLSKGPYVYELFSIMIHSGSASGGHYYAYIKDFSSGEWFCFNDTSVTRITTEDIAKTFGGGAFRSYYSGAYSSSTNAYMLMYRQIAKNNCEAMKINDFPDHIKKLYKDIQEKQENDRRFKERQAEMLKLKVYCQHPSKGLIDEKLYVYNDTTLYEATSMAFDLLKLEDLVSRSDCRLVIYNAAQESLEMSFDGRENNSLLEIMAVTKLDVLLLEIKNPEEEFESYELGSFAIKVHVVDMDKEEVLLPPISTRTDLTSTVEDLKTSLASHVDIKPSEIILLVEKYANEFQVLEENSASIERAGLYTSNKIFISKGPSVEIPFQSSKLYTIIDRFYHVITLHLSLPDTDPETLARMSIPSLSSVQAAAGKQAGDSTSVTLDKVSIEPPVLNGKTGSTPRRLVLPLMLSGGTVMGAGDDESVGACSSGAGGGHSDQSTSEDSSLTDSDRTLIGDVQDECMSDGENQLASPQEDEPTPLPPQEEENWDEHTLTKQYTYFKAYPYNTEDSKKMLKVLVDKRMSMEVLKRYLETYVGVPSSSFKLYRKQRLCETLNDFRNEDTVNIKLGRQLANDEQKIKVHQLVLNSNEPIKFLCEWVVSKSSTIGQSKKEIIEDVNKTYSLDLKYDKCRLRRKNWKNVGRVYLDHQKWTDDSLISQHIDVFLQELPTAEPVKDPNQVCLFVRHWHPSTLTLDPFDEIVLDGFTVDELKEKLSEKSTIPVENVEFAKPQGFFPCDMSVLNIQELDWNPKATTLDGWPLQYSEDGGVAFYRDSREDVKTLTVEERNELSSKENARLSSTSGTMNTYSPRKERPLKIYVDRRPCTNEADVD